MSTKNTIKTQRLILRPWQEADLEPFAKLNADPRVMEYFPGLKSQEESDELAKRFSDHIQRHGWGLWAVSLIETGVFIGFIGLAEVPFKAHFTPAVEIGWRLAFDYWGKGYATEGALAALEYGLKTLKLKEIVSFTAVQNMRSRAVMERIGMYRDPKDDFDHPGLPEGHPLRRHVLYRIRNSQVEREKYVCKEEILHLQANQLAPCFKMKFKKACLDDWEPISQWLQEPHVKEFWDNSPAHLEDILIFMKGRQEPSPYWNGIFDYWVGFIDDEPYCLLMTSELLPTQSDLPALWKTHLSKTGRTLSIDFMIGNKKYLGRGLGGPTLEAFTQFIQESVDRSVDTFFIDPADSNPRAKRVYEKGGFKMVSTFYRDFGSQKDVKHSLMVKKPD